MSDALCEVAAEIEAWVYGELDGETARGVAAHVAACAACTQEHALLVAERRLLALRADHAPLPDVAIVITKARKNRHTTVVAMVTLFAAAAAIVLAVAPRERVPTPIAKTATPASTLACYDDATAANEERAYLLRDAIATVDCDYAASLVVTPSSSPRGDSTPAVVTDAAFTPLPIEACQ